MDKIKAIQSVNEIKELMERSSKFVSLSGLTGILVGVYSLVGAWYVSRILGHPHQLIIIIFVALGVLLLSALTAFIVSFYKANRAGQKLFNKLTYRILWNFTLPLIAGGLFCITLIYHQHYGLTSSVMLLFYAMALINVSKYTFSNVAWLGYGFLILGILDSFWEGNGLLFWSLGFGALHIIYGILFYFLYEKDK